MAIHFCFVMKNIKVTLLLIHKTTNLINIELFKCCTWVSEVWRDHVNWNFNWGNYLGKKVEMHTSVSCNSVIKEQLFWVIANVHLVLYLLSLANAHTEGLPGPYFVSDSDLKWTRKRTRTEQVHVMLPLEHFSNLQILILQPQIRDLTVSVFLHTMITGQWEQR